MYFSELQYLLYPDLLNPGASKKTVVSDIFKRVVLRTDSVIDSSNYYEYAMNEFETLETVSDKLYGSPYYYWIILYMNSLIDPLWDLPLNSREFQKYVINKYGGSLQDIQNFSDPFDASYVISGNVCTITSIDTHGFMDQRRAFVWFSSSNKYNGIYTIDYISNYSFSVILEDELADGQNDVAKIHPPFVKYYMKHHVDEKEFMETDIDTWSLIAEDQRRFRRSMYDEEVIENQNKRIIRVLKPELLQDFVNAFKNELKSI
jgi:hypothetical protein